MIKPSLLAILMGCTFCCLTVADDQPAPAEVGLPADGPAVVQNDNEPNKENQQASQKQNPTPAENASTLQQQVADLQAEVKSLRNALAKITSAEKELETLKGKLAIVEGDNTALATRIKMLEDENTTLAGRVKRLEGDNAALLERTEEFTNKIASLESNNGKTQVTAAKPAFVKAAVRFHNHEGRPLRMNVNGVWHTIQEGENDVWVPYGPVHIYRYTGSEPKLFTDWKPYKDGYVMEFDVGTPPAK